MRHPARWIVFAAIVALLLPLAACSSPSVGVKPQVAGGVYAGPKAAPVGVSAELKGPELDIGSGAIAAPPNASWPKQDAAPVPAPAPAPSPAAPEPAPVSKVATSTACPGGCCPIPAPAPGDAPGGNSGTTQAENLAVTR